MLVLSCYCQVLWFGGIGQGGGKLCGAAECFRDSGMCFASSRLYSISKSHGVVGQDRVEASPEQLAQCSSVAEKVSALGGVQARVIGWYHSHPHITVLPSHVDLRTQASYQMLDEHFVGLIVSVFNEVGPVLHNPIWLKDESVMDRQDGCDCCMRAYECPLWLSILPKSICQPVMSDT